MKFGAIALLGLSACAGDDTDDKTSDSGTTPPGEQWTVIGNADNLPAAALLSIWGKSDDMFVVGADDGAGPVVLHWDGAAWGRLDTGTTDDLWWVWSDGGDQVLIGGEGARVVTYTRSTGAFSETVISTFPQYTIFGIWGSSPTDVWAVGGDVGNSLPGAIFHFDGTAWTQAAEAPADPDGNRRQAFKVWGSAADDVWVIGTGALVMHWDGAAWTGLEQPLYGETPLTTVSGRAPNDVYAVGGFNNAAVAHWDGTAWTDDSPPPQAIAPNFNGVFASAQFGVVACGGNGSIYWRQDTGWEVDARPPATARDFHACWIDEAGAVWAVGGDLTNQTEGVVIYGGDTVAPVSL
ncbi:MAG: hypothetical protein ABMB14_23955 [Myxococcota bacterium]